MDATDARLLLALAENPRATTVGLSDAVGASRNTIHARLTRFDDQEQLFSFERRVNPASLGYPLTAYVTAQVEQGRLDNVASDLARVAEVIEVHGVSGAVDLLIHVVALDADDLYRVAGQILAIPGVERTNTALVMRDLVQYRVRPLLWRLANESDS